jgi:hypothetical protein
MQTIPGGVNSWYVDSVVVSKRVKQMGWGWVLVFFLLLELLFRKVFRAMSQ